jgi:ankyrin repeat protein
VIAFLALSGLAWLVLASCGKIGIDKRDEHGMTSLMRAAQHGDLAEVERLIARGAKVNATVPTRDLRELIAFLSWMQQLPESDIGYTPLLYAAQGGHPDVARTLISHGADVHHLARGGETALRLAIFRSDLKMLQLLAAAGARSDSRQFGLAVRHSTPETVGFLLALGADPNAIPSPGVRRSGPPAPPPVIAATQRGEPAVLRLLIDAGANVNAQDHNGWSALRWAGRSGSGRQKRDMAAMIALLESAGARDRAGNNAAALFQAVLQKDPVRVEEALRLGANPNARDDRGIPPLIYAARLGPLVIVEALIRAGAQVNASPENGTTPLISAISGGNVEAVKALLAAGARIDQPDRLQRTPLQEASAWKRDEITRLLLGSSAPLDPTALAIAALNGSVEQVRMLIGAGADPNANNGHALHEAARGCIRRDNTEIIRLLLERGATPRVKADGEYTALHRAAALCEPEAVRLLLRHGADPNARDLNRATPLMGAASSGRAENLRLLIVAGADVSARDSYGKSVLDHASRYPEVQQELRRAGAR